MHGIDAAECDECQSSVVCVCVCLCVGVLVTWMYGAKTAELIEMPSGS